MEPIATNGGIKARALSNPNEKAGNPDETERPTISSHNKKRSAVDPPESIRLDTPSRESDNDGAAGGGRPKSCPNVALMVVLPSITDQTIVAANENQSNTRASSNTTATVATESKPSRSGAMTDADNQPASSRPSLTSGRPTLVSLPGTTTSVSKISLHLRRPSFFRVGPS